MRTIKCLAAAILCGVCTVSYFVGYDCGKQKYQQVYEDACRMSDLIRCYEDNLNDTTEVYIQDWGCFDELEGIFLYDDALGKPIDLSNYVYCY